MQQLSGENKSLRMGRGIALPQTVRMTNCCIATTLASDREENLVIGTDYGHAIPKRTQRISRFKAMENLNPQVKRKILSDNPRFCGI